MSPTLCKSTSGLVLALLLLLIQAGEHAVADVTTYSASDFAGRGGGTAGFIRKSGPVTILSFSGDYQRNNAAARAAVGRAYFQENEDYLDYLLVFTTFPFDTGGASAFYTPVFNDTNGIGRDPLNRRALFDSEMLQGYIDMNDMTQFSFDQTTFQYQFQVSIALHELQHRWGSFVQYMDAQGQRSDRLLGDAGSHWSYFLDSDASHMYGSDWHEISNGVFSTINKRYQYSDLDLYLGGFISADAVSQISLIESVDGTATDLPPPLSTTINGVSLSIDIDQIIAAEGVRIPAVTDSQKEFRAGIIILTSPGETVTDSDVQLLLQLMKDVQRRFSVETRGVASLALGPALPDGGTTGLPVSLNDQDFSGVPANLPLGVDWLLEQQHASGSWSDKGTDSIRDTVLALGTIEAYSADPESISAARQWLLSHPPESLDELSWLMRSGLLSAAQLELYSQGLAGDYSLSGANRRFRSSPLDQALLLAALTLNAPQDSRVLDVVEYLSETMNMDSGWGVTPQGISSVMSTAMVVDSFDDTHQLGNLSESVTRLSQQQNPDGSFGSDSHNALLTAIVIRALSTHADLVDPAITQQALEYLNQTQYQNGSWDGSIAATATVLSLLADFQLPNYVLNIQSNQQGQHIVRGDTVVLDALVSNPGVLSTPATTLSIHDDDVDTGAVLSVETVEQLEGGSSEQITVYLDTTVLTATSRISATVDPDNQVSETNEDDNRADIQFTLIEPGVAPEFVLSPNSLTVAPELIGSQPADLTVSFDISNLSTRNAEPVTVALYQRLAHQDLLLASSQLDLAAGELTHSELQAVISEATSSVQLLVVIDPANEWQEVNELNNTASILVPVGDGIDLTIPQAGIEIDPELPVAGEDVLVRVMARNGGTVSSPVATLRVLESTVDNSRVLFEQPVQLEVGEQVIRDLSWRPEVSGSYQIIASIDPEDSVFELLEDNNERLLEVTVVDQTQVNLVLDEASIVSDPVMPRQSEPLSIQFDVINSSSVAATSFTAKWYHSEQVPANLLATAVLPGLAPLSTAFMELSVDAIDLAGEQQFILVIDEDNQVAESNESDNDGLFTLSIAGLADAAINPASIDLSPPQPVPGQDTVLSYVVQNLGDQSIDTLHAHISLTTVDGQSVDLHQGVLLENLPGGSEQQLQIAFIAPDQLVESVSVSLDPDSLLIERTRLNNEATIGLEMVNSRFFMTHPAISPNGDGVRDSTAIVFDLDEPEHVVIEILDTHQRVIRRFDEWVDQAASQGQVVWRGRDESQRIVNDGRYAVWLKALDGRIIYRSSVIVDTNRWPLTQSDLDGTLYLTDLACTVQSLGTVQFSASGDYLYTDRVRDLQSVEHRESLYRLERRQAGFVSVVPQQWLQANNRTVTDFLVLEDGRKLIATSGNDQARLFLQGSDFSTPVELHTEDATSLAFLAADEHSVHVIGEHSGTRQLQSVSLTPGQPPVSYSVSLDDDFTYIAAVDSGLIFRERASGDFNGQFGSLQRIWFVPFDGSNSAVMLQEGIESTVVISESNSNYIAILSENGISNPPEVPDPIALITALDLTTGVPIEYLSLQRDLPDFWSVEVDFVGPSHLIVGEGHSGLLSVYDSNGLLIRSLQPDLVTLEHLKALVSPGTTFIDQYFRLDRLSGGPYFSAIDEDRDGFILEDPVLDQIIFSIGLANIEQAFRGTDLPAGGFVPVSQLFLADLRTGVVTSLGFTGSDEGNFGQNLGLLDQLSPSFPDLGLTHSQWLPGTNRILFEGPGLLDLSQPSYSALSLGSIEQAWPDRPGQVQTAYYSTFIPNAGQLACEQNSSGTALIESLDNLMAHLNVEVSTTEVSISGVISDRHLDQAYLEWADASEPSLWQPVGQTINQPVIDDIFAIWIPESPGQYRLRLTVRDKAGNQRSDQVSLSWAQSPSVGAASIVPDYLSPNGDSVNDVLTIQLDVYRPLQLLIQLVDASGQVLREFSDNILSAGQSVLYEWDGRDDQGVLVPDGDIDIRVQGNRYRAVIDTLLPTVEVQFTDPYASRLNPSTGLRVVDTRYHFNGLVSDANLNQVLIEQSPDGSDWTQLSQSTASSSLAISETVTLSELNETPFRIRATDRAGNTISANVIPPAAQLILSEMREITSSGVSSIPLVYQPAPFSTSGIPEQTIAPTGNTVALMAEVISADELQSIWIEYATDDAPEDWMTLSSNRVADKSRYQLDDELAAQALGHYREYVEFDISSISDRPRTRLRLRTQTSSGGQISNGVNLKQRQVEYDLRDFELDSRPLAVLTESERLLLDALMATGEVPVDDRTLIWALQQNISGIEQSRLLIHSSDDPRYQVTTGLSPITGVALPSGLFAQLFAVDTSFCSAYEFHWSALVEPATGTPGLVTLGDDGAPALERMTPCSQMQVDWGVHAPRDCSNSPSDRLTLQVEITSALTATTLEVYLQQNGLPDMLIANHINPPLNTPFSVTFSTTGLQEGLQAFNAVVTLEDGSRISRPLQAPIDRQVAQFMLESPANGQQVCANRLADGGQWLDVTGLISDNNRFLNRVSVSSNHQNLELVSLYPKQPGACDPDEDDIPGSCFEQSTLTGQLYPIHPDQSNLVLPDSGEVTVLVEVIDTSGAHQCQTRMVTLDSSVDLEVSTADEWISPNGDEIHDRAVIDLFIAEPLQIRIDVHPASYQVTTQRWVTSGESLGTIHNQQLVDQSISFEWDGRVNGQTLEDNDYLLVFTAMDQCGLSETRSQHIALDRQAPDVALIYPRANDPVGVIAEIIGRFEDRHFSHARLEVLHNGVTTVLESFDAPRREPSILTQWNLHGVQPGTYELTLSATDLAGNIQMDQSIIDLGLTQSLIWQFATLEPYFSPNGDQFLDQAVISLGVVGQAHFDLDIIDSTGALVRRLLINEALTAGSYQYLWDGLNDGSAPVDDGQYTVLLNARSSDGGLTQQEQISLIVDTQPPQITRLVPVADVVNQHTNVVLSVEDPLVPVTVVSHAANDQSSVPVITVEGRGDFNVFDFEGHTAEHHQLTIHSQDEAGNQIETTWSLTLDNNPPVVSILSPQPGGFLSHPLRDPLMFSVEDLHLHRYTLEWAPQGTEHWQLIEQGSEAGTHSIDALSLPADGDYHLRLTAEDQSGAVSAVSQIVVVDQTLPQAVIDFPADGSVAGAGALIMGTAFDAHLSQYHLSYQPVSETDVWLDVGGGQTAVSDGLLWHWFNQPQDGHYRLRLQVDDQAGYRSEAQVTIRLDTEAPAPARALIAELVQQGSVRLTWLASQSADIEHYLIIRDGAELGMAGADNTSFTDTSPSQGSHDYHIIAVDTAGNRSVPSNTAQVTIDNTAPETVILQPVEDQATADQLTILATAYSEDDFASYRLFLREQGEPSPGQLLVESSTAVIGAPIFDLDTTSLSDQTRHVLLLESTDDTGNIASVERAFLVDNLHPDPALNLSLSVLGPDSVQLDWGSSMASDLAGYVVVMNDQYISGDTGSLQSSLITTTSMVADALPDGLLEFTVIAVDQAGNQSVPSNAVTHLNDSRPPHMTFSQPADGSRFEQPLYIQLVTADTDIDSVDLQIRPVGGSWTTLVVLDEGPWDFVLAPDAQGLTHGQYQLQATAIDLGGQVDPSPEIITVEHADLTAPAAPQGLTAQVAGAMVRLDWDDNDDSDLAGYHVQLRDSSQNWVPATATLYPDSEAILVNLNDGVHVFRVVAEDEADNASQPSASVQAEVFSLEVQQPWSPTVQSEVRIDAYSAVAAPVWIDITTDAGPVSLGPYHDDGEGQFVVENIPLADGLNVIELMQVRDNGDQSRISTVFIERVDAPAAPSSLNASVSDLDVLLEWVAATGSNTAGFQVYRDSESISPIRHRAPDHAQANSSPDSAERVLDEFSETYWSPDLVDLIAGEVTLIVSNDSALWLQGVEIEWHVNYDANLDADVAFRPTDYEVSIWSGHAWISVATIRSQFDVVDQILLPGGYWSDQIRLSIHDAPVDRFEPVRLSSIRFISRTLEDAQNTIDQPGNGTFEYQVSTVSTAGLESELSETASAVVGDVTSPEPVVLSASASNDDVLLEWTASASADVDHYRVFRDGSLIQVLDATDGLSSVDASLPNGSYTYAVAAVDAAGSQSVLSNPVTITIDQTLPAAPAGVAVNADSQAARLIVTWQSVVDIDRYRVYRAEQAGGPYQQLAETSDLRYDDDQLQLNQDYFYVVTAVDQAGNESHHSIEVTGRLNDVTAPDRPRLFFPTTPSAAIELDQPVTAVAGSGEPGAIVSLFNNGTLVGTTPSNVELTESVVELQDYAYGESMSEDGRYLATSDFRDYLTDLTDERRIDLPTSYSDLMVFNAAATAIYLIDYAQSTQLIRFEIGSQASRVILDSDFLIDAAPSPDEQSIVFIGSAEDPHTGQMEEGFWLLDNPSGELSEIGTFDIDGYRRGNIAWSPDGQQLALIIEDGQGDSSQLWLHDQSSGALILAATDLQDNGLLEWSADASAVLFQRSVSGQSGLWRLQIDSMLLEKVVDDAEQIHAIRISPDGEQVAYFDSCCDLVIQSLENPDEQQLLVLQSGDHLAWNPDGRLFVLQGDVISQITQPGYFRFAQVILNQGPNRIHATATDAVGQTSFESEAIRVHVTGELLSDLSVRASDLSVTPATGSLDAPYVVHALIRNIGQQASAASQYTIIITAPDGSVHQSMSQSLPVIAPGQEFAVDELLDPVAIEGIHLVELYIDPANDLPESNEGNNSAATQFAASDSGYPVMNLSVNHVTVAPGEVLSGELTLINTAAEFTGSVSLEVIDTSGFAVALEESIDVTGLAFGDTFTHAFTWEPGALASGTFTLRASLFSRLGSLLEERSLQISVVRFADIDFSISSPVAVVDPSAALGLTAQLNVRAGNTPLTARIDWQIREASGAVVDSFTSSLPTLLPGFSGSLDVTRTAPIVAGEYQIRATLVTDLGDQSSELFIRVNDPASPQSVTGQLLEPSFIAIAGQDLLSRYRVTNTGDSSSEMIVSLQLRGQDGLQILRSDIQSLVLAAGEAQMITVLFDTSGLPLSNYLLVLSTTLTTPVPGDSILLDSRAISLIDGDGPELEVHSPVPNQVIAPPMVVAASAIDALQDVEQVQVRVDGDSSLPMTANPPGLIHERLLSGLVDGPHSLIVSAQDRSGNETQSPEINFVIDSVPPELMISGFDEGQFYRQAVIPVVSVSDANSDQLVVRLNSAPFVSGTAVSDDGLWRVQATAIDQAGLTSQATGSFTIDTVPPVVQVSYPADGQQVPVSTISLVGDTEPFAQVILNLGSQTVTAMSAGDGQFVLANVQLTEGTNSYTIVATDRAGNPSELFEASVILAVPVSIEGTLSSPVQLGVTEDLNLTVSVTNTGLQDIVNQTHRVQVIRQKTQQVQAEQFLELSIAAGQSVMESLSFTTNDFELGAYRLQLDYLDSSGSWQALSQSDVLIVDQLAPELTPIEPQGGALYPNSIEVSALANDQHGQIDSVEARLDQGQWQVLVLADAQAGLYSIVLDNLDHGPHQLTLRATDTFQNINTLPAIPIEVDAVPPVIDIDGVVDLQLTNQPVQAFITVSDDHPDTVNITLDGQPHVSGAIIDEDGAHELLVVAVDAAGNQSSRLTRFVIDTLAPTLSVSSPVDGLITGADRISVTGLTEPLLPVELVLDQLVLGAVADSEGRFEFIDVPLQPGNNLLQLHSTDLAQNDSDTAVLTVVRDQSVLVSGSLDLINAAPTVGDLLTMESLIGNDSAIDINGLRVRVEVIRQSTSELMYSSTTEWDLAAGTQQIVSSQTESATWLPDTYRIELASDGQSRGATWTQLDQLVFSLLPPGPDDLFLIIDDPESGSSWPAGVVTVSGRTRPNLLVSLINRNQLYNGQFHTITTQADSGGDFVFENLSLSPGANRLELTVEDMGEQVSQTLVLFGSLIRIPVIGAWACLLIMLGVMILARGALGRQSGMTS